MAISKIILNGVTQMDVTSDTVTAAKLLSGETATKNDGTKVTGSIASKTSSDLTASGATVTAPAGYYASNASKSVASGTAGTPTATKGTVSNHAVSVTPSVTNTTGYITGSTKTGTAVSVSASELVSGTKSITENGTVDVTNYASASVNVSGGGGATLGSFIVTPTTLPTYPQYIMMEVLVPSASGVSSSMPYSPLLTHFGGTGTNYRRTCYWYLSDDGYMYVALFGDTDSFWPQLTATSGTATVVTSITQGNATYNNYYKRFAVVWYKISNGAEVNLSYYNNN